MSHTPEQMRKKAEAEAEALRHLRYAQADGSMKGEAHGKMPEMYPDHHEKMVEGG